MHWFSQHALVAVRSWRQAPVPVAAAVLALALAIGASTATFSVLAALLLEPLPYADAERLVMVWHDASAEGRSPRDLVSPGLYVEWAKRSRTLEAFGAMRGWQPNLTGVEEPERLRGALVSAGYFEALGIAPALGRTFTPADDRPDGTPVAVLSFGLWQRRFGGEAAVVGSTIVLDGTPTLVTGIMPADFRAPFDAPEIWGTIRIDPVRAPRGLVVLRVLAKLRAGVTLDGARAEMAVVAADLRPEDPEWTRLAVAVIPLHEELTGGSRTTLFALAGGVALVLLIACANVGSLLLARAVGRARDVTVRVVLGASRRHIIAPALAESLALAAAGGLPGLLLAFLGVRALVALAPPSVAGLADVEIDGRILLFGAIFTLATATLTALAPALWASRAALSRPLAAGGRGSTAGTLGLRMLVFGQGLVVMVLAVGAGLFVRTLAALDRVDLGFNPTDIVTAAISPPRTVYRDHGQLVRLYEPILGQARSGPGIEDAALVSVLPLGGLVINMDFGIEGLAPTRGGGAPIAGMRSVSPNYFDVMGIRILDGRGFTPVDRSGQPAVVVVNETLAARYWPEQTAVGKRVFVEGTAATIVGVVADVRHRGPAVAADAELYRPLAQAPPPFAWIVLKTTLDPPGAGKLLRHAVRQVDSQLPVAQVSALEQSLGRTLAERRFVGWVLGGFAAIATLLALVGIYGVMAFYVNRTQRDLGIRLALGARPASILVHVLRLALSGVAPGVIAGGVVAVFAWRLLQSLLFDVAPGDVSTLALTGLATVLVGAAAAAIPAWRAARIEPLAQIRTE